MNLSLCTHSKQPPAHLSKSEIAEDVDTLIFALQQGYVGFDVLYQETNRAIERLEMIKNTGDVSPEELGREIGTILSELPDGHMSVSFKKMEYVQQDREKKPWPIGKNIGCGVSDAVWNIQRITVKGKEIPAVSILSFPHPNSPIWEGFEKAIHDIAHEENIIIDLRGNSGGNSQKAKELAKILINDTVTQPHKKIITKNTPEAYQLSINLLISQMMQMKESGQTIEHMHSLIDEKEKRKQEVIEGEEESLLIEIYEEPNVKKCTFGGKIFILADRNCGSSGEHALRLLKFYPGAVFIGEPTAGLIHFGNSGMFDLPTSTITVRMCTRHFVSFDGNSYEKIGYPPDISVPAGKDALEFVAF